MCMYIILFEKYPLAKHSLHSSFHTRTLNTGHTKIIDVRNKTVGFDDCNSLTCIVMINRTTLYSLRGVWKCTIWLLLIWCLTFCLHAHLKECNLQFIVYAVACTWYSKIQLRSLHFKFCLVFVGGWANMRQIKHCRLIYLFVCILCSWISIHRNCTINGTLFCDSKVVE